jgi:hypothetical protein
VEVKAEQNCHAHALVNAIAKHTKDQIKRHIAKVEKLRL